MLLRFAVEITSELSAIGGLKMEGRERHAVSGGLRRLDLGLASFLSKFIVINLTQFRSPSQSPRHMSPNLTLTPCALCKSTTFGKPVRDLRPKKSEPRT